MKRWKREVFLLILLSAVTYVAYLIWLYRASGGSMVVSYEMPEWTFPSLVGAVIFAIAFGGGFAGLALTNPDLSKEKAGVLQLFLISLLLGAASTIIAFWMTGFLSIQLTLVLLTVALAPILLVARAKREKLTPSVPVTDEREKLIDIKSRALAGDILMTAVVILMLLATYDKSWEPGLQGLFLGLLALWAVSWLAARVCHGRRM